MYTETIETISTYPFQASLVKDIEDKTVYLHFLIIFPSNPS